jgi:hypothetical protein
MEVLRINPSTARKIEQYLEDCAITLLRDLGFLKVSTDVNSTVTILRSSCVLFEIGRKNLMLISYG